MAEIHTGSWTIPGTNIGLPDFGVTEAVARMFGQNMNSQGGSQLRSGSNLPGGNTPYQGTAFNTGNMSYTPSAGGGTYTYNTPSPDSATTGGSQPQRSSSTSSNTPPNPWTTYINGKKLADMMKDGEADQWGNPIQRVDPMSLAPSQQQIDDTYNFYDQIINDKNANKQSFLDQYTKPYDELTPGVKAAYDTGMGQINTQRNDTSQQEANAIAAARRLYNEMTQGVNQRFGGSNSAGDFANQFYGREFQRQYGNIQNTAGQNQQALNKQANDLLTNYNAKVQEIDLKKQTALSQAQAAFQQEIDRLNETKGQAKAAAKLSLLQELRNRAYQIEDQATQLRNSIYANHVAAMDQLRNSVAGYQAMAGKTVDMNDYGTPSFSQIGGGTSSFNPSNIVSGYYDPTRRYNQTG